MTRRIVDLKWARASQRPAGLPIGRPRGAKAAGLRYQSAVATSLGSGASEGNWFEYEDKNGRGVCQTDLLFQHPNCLVILEVKYTWTAEGHQQLEWLYGPVVSAALKQPVIGIQVCRRLTAEALAYGITVTSTLESAIANAAEGRRVVWHWLAQGQMLTRPKQRREAIVALSL